MSGCQFPFGVAGPPLANGGAARPPQRWSEVATRHPQWAATPFLFSNFFIIVLKKNLFIFLINLYFFIMIETCDHLISADVTPN